MGQDRIKDIQIIDMVMTSQLKALEELRLESEELYQAAIQVKFSPELTSLFFTTWFSDFLTFSLLFQIDPNLVPFTVTGPVHTPPIKGYDAPDGDYVDVSKNWYEMPKFG
jgi:large subunit ribosomal protein L40